MRWRAGHAAVLHLAKRADFTAPAAAPTAEGTFHVVQQNAWPVTVKAP